MSAVLGNDVDLSLLRRLALRASRAGDDEPTPAEIEDGIGAAIDAVENALIDLARIAGCLERIAVAIEGGAAAGK